MQIERVPVESLVFDPVNARKHDKRNLDAIKGSLAKFGQQKVIVVDANNVVIAGNGTLEAAKVLGWKDIDVHRSPLKGAEAIAFALADNKTAELATWDEDILGEHLAALYKDGWDIEDIGFSMEDLNFDGKTEGNTDPDEVPEVEQNKFKVERGQVWQLGDHRMMCGDSTSKDDVEKLMAGKKADMVFTDPPYRMDAEGGSNQMVGKAAAKLGERIKHLCDFDPDAFLGVIPILFLPKKMNAYIFCNKDLVPDYLNWAIKSGYAFNILFWKKPNAIPLGGQHRPDTEYLLFFRKGALWNGGLKGVNYSKCLEFEREKHDQHPTLKPVGLITNEVQISSNKGGLVVDTFLGSGSTLIACEKTGRKCYGMEIDPHYCSVILERWQNFTGKEAQLLG